MDNIIKFNKDKVRSKIIGNNVYFSIVDIIFVLTGNEYQKSRKYWNKLKERLIKEGSSQSVTNCHQLKLKASDGKNYKTDCANLETCFRIIQSIPSKKAEPFKKWLAKVGYERIQEIENPEIAQKRMMEIYKQKGYDEVWIRQRIQAIVNRKELTDEWNLRGASEVDYAMFTALMTKGTFGITPVEYKKIKNLNRENLRDHMGGVELALVNLGEVTAKEMHKTRNSKGRRELKKDVIEAGEVSGEARKDIEKRLKKSVVSSKNFLKKDKELE